MNSLERIDRLYDIHRRIKQEETGEPNAFAEQMHLSRSHLYNLIAELKDYGAEIKYSRKRQTFYYAGDFTITIHTLNLSS
jgi:predicted DNA-binding transcriptional regulator YafY